LALPPVQQLAAGRTELVQSRLALIGRGVLAVADVVFGGRIAAVS
jgi:hypothetical protein